MDGGLSVIGVRDPGFKPPLLLQASMDAGMDAGKAKIGMPVRPWASAIGVLAAGTAAILWLHFGNPRLLASWHGFLHSAIANRFGELRFPPENPFFAGEPLPYYWFYHFAGFLVSQLLRVDLLHTFHAVSWFSLLIFVIFAYRIGIRLGSARAGMAIMWLGLAGVNPLGPGIAASKYLLRGTPLIDHRSGPVETTFVSDSLADDLMTQPLLPGMYIGSDWRHGQDLMWFFDVASRAPTLAALMVLLYLALEPGAAWTRYTWMAVTSFLATAFSPLIGLAVGGALGATAVLAGRRATGVACLLGAALAAPTYHQMFFRISGGSGMELHLPSLLSAAMLAANFLILLPLAAFGGWGAKPVMLTAMAAAGALLVLAVALVHLPQGNEHNLSNAAQCLLAVPAGAMAARAGRRVLPLLVVLFLPVTLGTLISYAARPPMPIAASGRMLVRTPENGDLERFYEWVRRETPRQTIVVSDPAIPVKMSGNVSELPAFTGRTLFTDTPNYLTSPNRDAAFRAELAGQATRGEGLSDGQREYLARFGRPVLIVTYQAGEAGLKERLAGLYGPPVFQQGIVAAFRFQ